MKYIEVDFHDMCGTIYDPAIILTHLSQTRPIHNISRATVPALEHLIGRLNGEGTKFGLRLYVLLLNKFGFTIPHLYQRIKELPIEVIPEMIEEVKRNNENGIYQVSVSCNLDILQLALLDRLGIAGYYDKTYANSLYTSRSGKLEVEIFITPRTKSLYAEKALKELEIQTRKKAKILHLHTDGKTDYPHFCQWVYSRGGRIIYSPKTPRYLRRRLEKEFRAMPLLTSEIKEKLKKEIENNPLGWLVELVLHHSGHGQTKS